MKWVQSERNLENLIHQTCKKIHQLATISCLEKIGGVLRITSSDSLNHIPIAQLRDFAEQKNVVLYISNYR